jgi:cephalosporin-C deacetylase-like acetyl esterase
MIEERVAFFSGGQRVAGLLRLPDPGRGGSLPPSGWPAIVQGPGWLQLKEAKRNLPYHQAFTDAGFAVLVIDFRGFGESDGDPTELSPAMWLEDLQSAVTFLTTRDDVDADRIGTFGSGSTGGGNAVMLGGVDQRVRCAVSQVPIADGADWLRRMRREGEWFEFLARIEADRQQRVLTGQSELVHPREELMVKTAERLAREASEKVEDGHVQKVTLRSADALLAYRPIDVAASARALLVIGVEDDPVTPTDHCTALYDRAPHPKKLIIQRNTSHYGAYEQYAPVVIPEMVAWFGRHLTSGPIDVREDDGTGDVQRTIGPTTTAHPDTPPDTPPATSPDTPPATPPATPTGA